jgi:hypothetical protein
MYISLLGLLLAASLLVVGYRRRRQRGRRAFIIAGWIVLSLQLLPLICVVDFLYRAGVRFEHEPASWLLSEVEEADSHWRSEAYAELLRRLDADELSEDEIDRLADSATVGLKRGGSFAGAESETLNRLRRLGRLTAEQQRLFLEGLLWMEMRAKSPASVSYGVPVRVGVIPGHCWSDPELWWAVEITPTFPLAADSAPRVRVGRDGRLETRVKPAPAGPLIMQGGALIAWEAVLDVDHTGRQDLGCDVKITWYDGRPAEDPAAQPLHTSTRHLKARTEVVASPVRIPPLLVTDPIGTPQVRGTDGDWSNLGASFDVVAGDDGKMLRTSVRIIRADIGYAFDVTVAVEGVIHPAGSICDMRSLTTEWVVLVPCPEPEPETIALTLTPNPELAAESAEIPEIWGEPIVLEDILRRREPEVYPLKAVERTFP